jgi:hypothetical protein
MTSTGSLISCLLPLSQTVSGIFYIRHIHEEAARTGIGKNATDGLDDVGYWSILESDRRVRS